jgi:hypothetical protein
MRDGAEEEYVTQFFETRKRKTLGSTSSCQN